MDWLKSILESLPLEKLSDILGEIVIWWSQMVKNVPPADLPMYAYLGGSIVVLLLWILVARILPRPLGGMSWMVLFAVLLAPGTALNDPSVIAPASISVVYAIMMKDTATAITNALPILVVLVVGLFVGFVWQLIRGAFDSSLDKARRRSTEDAQANMQLATGNYIEEKNSESLLVNIPVTTQPSINDSMNAKQEINLKKQSSNDDIDKTLSTIKPSTQVNDGSVDSDKKL
ncbi:hypothetical protein [Psychrobacter sp. P2G3]|uniref:hypothetical protein n=1 Tax=Psychrobacter sp. P2G3 TaxID=1699622 RepID=UPI000AE4457A|nr:hypothetical protein [Psychrobacter sp. P2G3]